MLPLWLHCKQLLWTCVIDVEGPLTCGLWHRTTLVLHLTVPDILHYCWTCFVFLTFLSPNISVGGNKTYAIILPFHVISASQPCPATCLNAHLSQHSQLQLNIHVEQTSWKHIESFRSSAGGRDARSYTRVTSIHAQETRSVAPSRRKWEPCAEPTHNVSVFQPGFESRSTWSLHRLYRAIA